MNRHDFFMLWIEALESGKYEQGHYLLRRTMADTGKTLWCCLGVACELYKENINPSLSVSLRYASNDIYSYDGNDADLPSQVSKFLGLDSIGTIPLSIWESATIPSSIKATLPVSTPLQKVGALRERSYPPSLSQMNDQGWSFDHIAQVLREHVKTIISEVPPQ